MSKALETLIKLRQRDLDALRKKLGDAYNQREMLDHAYNGVVEERAREEQLAMEDINLARFFGDFANQCKHRLEIIQDAINQTEEQITALRELISQSFSELKKFEIALENERLRQREEQARRDQAFLDELGTRGFQKRQEEEGG